MNGNAHSLGSSFDKISPENNVPQTNKHANNYHSLSSKPKDHVSSYHDRESMENNGSQYKIAANSMSSHTHMNQNPSNQQQHLINNEKRFKNYKLISDPLLRKGAQKVYRYDGVPTSPRELPIQVKDPRNRMNIYDSLWSHREPVELLMPRFKIDKNYVGVPPAIEVSITNLNDNINTSFLEEMLRKFDNCEEIEILYHPKTNKHLGLAKVVFWTPAGARHCVERIHGTSVMGNIINVFFDPFFKSIASIFESVINPPVSTALTDSAFLDPNNVDKLTSSLPSTSDFVFSTDSTQISNELMSSLNTPSSASFETQSFFQSSSQNQFDSQQWTESSNNNSPLRESLETRIHKLITMQCTGKLTGFLSEIDLTDINSTLRLNNSPDHRRTLQGKIDDSDAFLGTPPSPFVSASEYLKWHKFTKQIDIGGGDQANEDSDDDEQKNKDAKGADDDDDRMSLSSLSSGEKVEESNNMTNGNHLYTSTDQTSSMMPALGSMWKPGMSSSYTSFLPGKNPSNFNGSMMPTFMYQTFVPGGLSFSRFSGFNVPSALGLPADIFSQDDMSPTKHWTKPRGSRNELIMNNIQAESAKCLIKDLKEILTKDILKKIVENYSFKMFDQWWEESERKSKSTTENKTSSSNEAPARSGAVRRTDIYIPLFNPLFENSIHNRHDPIVPSFEFGLTRGMRMPVMSKLPSFKRKLVKRSPNRAFNSKLSDISDDEDELRHPRRGDRRDEERRRRRRHSVSSQSSRSSRRSSYSSRSSSSSSSSDSSKSSSDDDRSSTSSSGSSDSEKSSGSDSDSSDASATSASTKRSTRSSASSKVSTKSHSSRSSRTSRVKNRKIRSPISTSPERDSSRSPARVVLPESKAALKTKHSDLSEISADNDSDIDTDRTATADEADVPDSEFEEDKQLRDGGALNKPSLDISSIEYEATQGLMALSRGFLPTEPTLPTNDQLQPERYYQDTFEKYLAFEHSYIVRRPASPSPEEVAAAASIASMATNTTPAKPKGKVGRPRKEKQDNNKENQQKGRKRKANEVITALGDDGEVIADPSVFAVASEWRKAKRKNVVAASDHDDSLLQLAVDNDANKGALLVEPLVTFPPRDSTAEAEIFQDFLKNGIDEEDVSYLKRSFAELMQEDLSADNSWLNDIYWVDQALPPKKWRRSADGEATSAGLGVHKTGCARSEGYYKQDSKDKIRYYFQETSEKSDHQHKSKQQQTREARTNQRRYIANTQDFSTSDLLRFNQLKFRKKQLRFSKSKIHEWGLFAMESIAADEMVIEYVGQQQRAIMADILEKKYEKIGIGSSYLFKIDSETIIDATTGGNVARFINHSCTPNCTAKVILVEGQKKIVIYSKQEIQAGEEITYDYKFPLEDVKIKCLCQTSGCRGFLN